MELINPLLESTLAKVLLLPLGYGLFRFIEYLIRRKVEKSGETETIRTARDLVDLQRAMNEGNITLDQINGLRDRLLGRQVDQDVVTANFFISRAEYMYERPAPQLDNDRAHLTQAEMSQLAYDRFEMASDELAAIFELKLTQCSDEESAALQTAQGAWVAWRDAEAAWESTVWEGGSIRPLMVAARLEALTRERIAAIQLAGQLEHDDRILEMQYKSAPRDLPERLLPGATSARVRELIGSPHFISGEYWSYTFKEVHVEIGFEGEVIRDITFALISDQKYDASLSEVNDYVFGDLTFGDLRAEGAQLDMKHRSTAHTHEVFTTMGVGLPGTYRTFHFGAIMPFRGTRLAHTDFAWDLRNDEPAGFPADAIINWFGITSRYDEDLAASWYIR